MFDFIILIIAFFITVIEALIINPIANIINFILKKKRKEKVDEILRQEGERRKEQESFRSVRDDFIRNQNRYMDQPSYHGYRDPQSQFGSYAEELIKREKEARAEQYFGPLGQTQYHKEARDWERWAHDIHNKFRTPSQNQSKSYEERDTQQKEHHSSWAHGGHSRFRHQDFHNPYHGMEYGPNVEPLRQAYEVLGISHFSSIEEIKKAYRKLINKHHPDKLASKGLPEGNSKELTQKIIAAYELIRKEKGFK